MEQNHMDDESALVQVMAWVARHKAISNPMLTKTYEAI